MCLCVKDIEVKAGQQLFSPGEAPSALSVGHLDDEGHAIMDEQWLQHASISGSQPPVLHSVGSGHSNSFSHYNDIPDDPLISCSLADIPVEQSPFLSRRHRMNIPGDTDSLKEMERLSSGGGSLQHLADHNREEEPYDDDSSPSSHEWSLSPQDKGDNLTSPEWFPDSNVRHLDSLSFPVSVHHAVMKTTESTSKTREQGSEPSNEPKKFSQRLKETLLSFTGSNRKIPAQQSSASTDALDRLKVSSLTSSLPGPGRSHSSECMRIKPPKKGRPALTQLTRVSSADNVFSGEASWLSDYPVKGGDDSQLASSWRRYQHPTPDGEPNSDVVMEMPLALKSTSSDASPSQLDENGRSPSEEDNLSLSGYKSRLGHGRSYRSHRLKLHNSRTSTSTLSEEDGSLVTLPHGTPTRQGVESVTARRTKGRNGYRHSRIKQQFGDISGSSDLSPLHNSPSSISDIVGLGSNIDPSSFVHSRHTNTYHRPLTKSSSLNESTASTSSRTKRSPVTSNRMPAHRSNSLIPTITTTDKSIKIVVPPFSPNSLAAMGAGASTAVSPISVTSATAVIKPAGSDVREQGHPSVTTIAKTSEEDRRRREVVETRLRPRASKVSKIYGYVALSAKVILFSLLFSNSG